MDNGAGMADEAVALDTSSDAFKNAAEEYMRGSGLHKALEGEREARKKLEGQVKQFDGIDPDEVRKVLADKVKAEEERARAEGDFEKLLVQERDKFAKELATRDEGTKGLRRDLAGALIDSAATKAISKFGGDSELLLPHVQANTRLIEVNGKHVAVVLDEAGEPRLAPDAKTATDYMGVEQLVGGWKEAGKFAGAFAGTGASGGGASASTRNGGAGTPRQISVEDSVRMPPDDLKAGIQSGQLQVVG